MQEILYITAEVDTLNNIQIADVCDAIIAEMERLKKNALEEFDEKIELKSGNLETVDDELVGDWVIEPRRKRR